MKKIIILFLLPVFAFSQKGNVKGVVSYYFNENLGNKPDIGAKVYVFNSDMPEGQSLKYYQAAKSSRMVYLMKMKTFNIYNDLANKYEGKKKYQKEYDEYRAKADKFKSDADAQLKVLETQGIETQSKYDTLDSRSSAAMINAIYNKPVAKTTVDGVGNYSIDLAPGKYSILLVSTGRKGGSVTEAMGKIYIREITITPGATTDLSYNFPAE